MSYGDARQNRTVAFGAVALVHAALGYALLTGLATDVIHRVVDGPLETYQVVEPLPPPPEPKAVPRLERAVSRPVERITAPVPRIEVPGDSRLVGAAIDLSPPMPLEPLAPVGEPPAAPTVSRAKGVAPLGNQGDWFPQDSYPAAARRANAEGRVSVRVTVGTDGRVAGCEVTASSGNDDLDQATCRLARRNGRFAPARDADGAPMASSFTLRNVRWLLQ